MDLICCRKNLPPICGLETALTRFPFCTDHPLRPCDGAPMRRAGRKTWPGDGHFENGDNVKLKLPL
jgi:hypothetical protein